MNLTDRFFRLALPVLAGGVLSACSVARPMNPGAFHNLRPALDGYKALEETDSSKAIAQYRAYLKRESGFNRPFGLYQERLSEGLERVSKGWSAHNLTLAEGVPTLYEKRLQGMADAYLGLARAYKKSGDLKRSERNAVNAVELMKNRSIFPASRDEKLLEAFKFLEELYISQGLKYPAMGMKLQVKLVQEHQIGRAHV